MIALPINNDLDYHYIRISKLVDNNEWELKIGPWYKNSCENEYSTKKEIILSEKDLYSLAKIIRSNINSNKQEVEENLSYYPFTSSEKKIIITKEENIIFLPNAISSPKVRIEIYKMDPKKPFYDEKNKDKVLLSLKVNVFDRIKQYHKDDDNYAYLYENGGKYLGARYYFSPESLLKFADDLENEVKKYERDEGFWGKLKKSFS